LIFETKGYELIKYGFEHLRREEKNEQENRDIYMQGKRVGA
jgi:hypothetical protein